jgi:uncharacterized protein with PQ loop repeat
MLDIIGTIGGIILAFSALPPAVQAYKQKNADHMSWLFILTWFIGMGLLYIYAIGNTLIPLILNYTINLSCLSIIIYYKVRK